MKTIALAITAIILSSPAWAQAVNGLGFTPPSTVPTFQNLGGTFSGVHQGITSFTLSDVKTIPVLKPGTQNLQNKVDGFFSIVTPAPN